ncbi:MAG TPA: NAD(P)-binding domain-containing protein [bacterium]|nr:NAD(P)-binding domain-containing protein [bacterium]
MRVGMLGTGDVGQALGTAFITLGHEVMMGSRDGSNTKANGWVEQAGDRASQGTFADAASFGELIVLATHGMATEGILRSTGQERFAGKVVIDATNPLEFSTGAPQLAIVGPDSLGERIQAAPPGASVVKAFNTVGSAHMFRPDFAGGPPDMFICGNDGPAKDRIATLLRDFGWGTVDIGDITGSRFLEAMCMVWVRYGFVSGTWNHAFKLLRK